MDLVDLRGLREGFSGPVFGLYLINMSGRTGTIGHKTGPWS